MLKSNLKNETFDMIQNSCEESILVDKNYTLPTNQIVIKGVLSTNKIEKKWSLEKI